MAATATSWSEWAWEAPADVVDAALATVSALAGEHTAELLPEQLTAEQRAYITPVLLGCLALWLLAHDLGQRFKHPRGPYALPIVHNLWQLIQMFRGPPLAMYSRLVEDHGATFQARIPTQPRLVITTDPVNVEWILKKNFDNYVKGPDWQNRFEEVLGNGIFSADGHAWLTQRKTASHLFNVKSFREDMSVVFRRHGRDMCAKLEAAAESGAVLDMQELFFRFTMDSIGEIAFGVNLGSMHSEDVPFARAFDRAQQTLNERWLTPMWRLRRLLGLGGEKDLPRDITVMNEFCADLLKARRSLSAEQMSTRTDLLSRFMALRDKSGSPVGDDTYFRDIIMNFMIAGRDTTANLLSWATYMLATNRDVEERVWEELDAVLGEGDAPTFDQAAELKYLQAVTMETLRLYPSVPKDGKYVVADDTWPDGTRVHRGDMATFLPYAMGRRAELWPDPLRFDPQRFMGSKDREKPSPFKFTAFQAGPRLCLGVNMAYLEAKTLLAMIHKHFQLHLVPGTDVCPERGVTLRMRHPLSMTVTRRRGARRALSPVGAKQTARVGPIHD